jgi:hypothetical protein
MAIDQLLLRPIEQRFHQLHPDGRTWQNRQYVLSSDGDTHQAAVEGVSRAPFRPDLVLQASPADRHLIVEVLEDSHRQSRLFYHPQNEVVRLVAIAQAHVAAKASLPAVVLVNLPRWQPERGLHTRLLAVQHLLDALDFGEEGELMATAPPTARCFPLFYVDAGTENIFAFDACQPVTLPAECGVFRAHCR